MTGLSKILVVVVVLCGLGYVSHRFLPKQAEGMSPNKEAAAPESTSTAPVTPAVQMQVYPTHAALVSMRLDYEVVHTNPDGSLMVLPLPPGAAMQTTVLLSPSGHHNLSIAVPDDKCAAGIDVNVYRLDQEAPIYTGSLSPAPKNAPLVLNFETLKVSVPFIVTVKLVQGAQNNWFCNVALSWDGAK